MRRATEATGHKTASAYGYATHTKPQGFIIRPPLLTTNKVSMPASQGVVRMICSLCPREAQSKKEAKHQLCCGAMRN